MVKKLTRTGNSAALVLDKELLARTGIDPAKPVEVSTHGQTIVISPVQDQKRARKLALIMAELDTKFGNVFKRLAE
jgi:antitoxin component of MazEF toxin-antitoxin module